MRCMACGSEMVLMNVVQDDTMPVPGFEHHTFMCSECHDVERRLIFTKHGREGDIELVPEHAAPSIAGEQGDNDQPVPLLDAAPSIAPTPVVVDERAVGLGLLRRVVAKVRGR
jgi:hypothetical protein